MKKSIVKRVLCIVLSAAMIFGLTACGSSASSSEQSSPAVDAVENDDAGDADPYAALGTVTWKVGHNQTTDNFQQIVFERFADYVSEKSGGKFKIEVYHDGQLGADAEMIEGAQMGTVDGLFASATTVSAYVNSYSLFALPGVFKDSEALEALLFSDEEMQPFIEDAAAAGLKYAASSQTFFRGLFTKERIETPEELKGVTIRIMSSDVITDTWTELGVDCTATAFGELYSALQLGVCDGLDHVASSVVSSSFYEVTDYICYPNLFISPMMIFFSQSSYDALDPAYQNLIDDAIANCLAPDAHELGNESDTEALEFLTGDEGGMELVDVDTQQFIDAVSEVRDSYLGQLDPWVQEIADEFINN